MRFSPMLAIAAVALIMPAAAAAQNAKLEVGKWTGTVTTPGGDVVNVVVDVTNTNDTTRLSLNAGEHGTFDARNFKFDGATLSFVFTPGPDVTCTLKKQDSGSYSGDCLDDGGGVAPMVINPPKAEKKG